MPARAFVAVDVLLVDAVVHDAPLVGAGDVEHRVVGRAVDLLVGTLDEYRAWVGHLDGAEGAVGCSVGHVVVGRARVVDRPQEVVDAVAVEHVGSFAEGVGFQCAALRSHHGYRFLLQRGHVVVEFGAGHVAVAPVEVVFSRGRVAEHINIDLLPMSGGRVLD